MNPRVVLDTNIVISAALGTQKHLVPAGRPSLCVALALAGLLTPIVSTELLKEYSRVLQDRRFGLSSEPIHLFIAALVSVAETVDPKSVSSSMVHPKDQHVLACAHGGKADFLITGNRRHFPESYGKTRIVTPAEFFPLIAMRVRG